MKKLKRFLILGLFSFLAGCSLTANAKSSGRTIESGFNNLEPVDQAMILIARYDSNGELAKLDVQVAERRCVYKGNDGECRSGWNDNITRGTTMVQFFETVGHINPYGLESYQLPDSFIYTSGKFPTLANNNIDDQKVWRDVCNKLSQSYPNISSEITNISQLKLRERWFHRYCKIIQPNPQ